MTTLETLQALSDEELIDRVAVEVMGWEKEMSGWWIAKDERNLPVSMHPWTDLVTPLEEQFYSWNPLTDWGHWREVEMKLLEGPWESFVTYLIPACSVDTDWAMHAYASTSLRSRCIAALLAVSA